VEAGIDGRWVTLDATPAARAETIQQGGGLLKSWTDVKNYFSSLWSRFVVGMTLADQKRSLYSPLESTAKDAWNSVSQERKKSATGLQALLEFLSNPSRWFSWQGGLLSFVLMVMLATLYWAARKVAGLLRNLSSDLASTNRQRIQIAFYERFRRLCEAHGLHRKPAQTQREFADEVAGTLEACVPAHPSGAGMLAGCVPAPLAARGQPAGIASLPLRLTTAFYDVRFGARDLGDGDLREIEGMLKEFEQRLPQSREAKGPAVP
jgi:hypothetical protein